MKGYWIARVTVSDPDTYQKYVEQAPAAFEKYGATPLARGGRCQHMEGEGRPRNVVLEFPSYDDAIACFNSPEYQAAREHRVGAGEAEIVIVEGV